MSSTSAIRRDPGHPTARSDDSTWTISLFAGWRREWAGPTCEFGR
jgi:hypothetical protein